MLWKRITVENQERALVAKNGRLRTILTPGEYRILVAQGTSLSIEKHTLSEPLFQSIWSDYLVRHHPDLVDCHFHRVETNETQIALVYLDGELYTVLTPSKRILFWRALAVVTAEFVDVIGKPAAETAKAHAFKSGTGGRRHYRTASEQASARRSSTQRLLAQAG